LETVTLLSGRIIFKTGSIATDTSVSKGPKLLNNSSSGL
jgi:hypothetical protein